MHKGIFSMVLFLSITAIMLNGCSENMRSQIGNIFKLRKALIKKYNHDDINIKITNGRFLVISVVNSRFNDMEAVKRKEVADEIAQFAVSKLAKNSKIIKIAVAFIIHEKKYLIVDYTKSLGSYSFNVSELSKPMPAKQPNKVHRKDKISLHRQ